MTSTISNPITDARRLDAYKKVCARFELDPAGETCAAEDYEAVLLGDIELTRFVHVTQAGNIVYVEPSAEDRESAFERAVENINDDIFEEAPIAVVDLDNGNTYFPQWKSLRWRMQHEQVDVPMRATGVYDAQSAVNYLRNQTGKTSGSRYGDSARECGVYALAWLLLVTEDAEGWNAEATEYALGLALNDSDDLARFLPDGPAAAFHEAAARLFSALSPEQ